MKRRQNSDRTIFYKKLNIFDKGNRAQKRLNDKNIFLYPLIINEKNNKYQNLKENFPSIINGKNRIQHFNNFETSKINNFYNSSYHSPFTQEKKIQTNNLYNSIYINKKDKSKELLFKKINKFLFSKKINKNTINNITERNSIFNISNYSPNYNSFNTTKYKSISNIKYAFNKEKSNLTTKKYNKFIANNYVTNITKFNYQLFKYNLFKRKRKFDKLLYNMRKSEVSEIRKINNDLCISKAKCENSKNKRNRKK